ncbi:MAG: hypothetical protein WDO24_27020 [Pseudomonadota bacterium]
MLGSLWTSTLAPSSGEAGDALELRQHVGAVGEVALADRHGVEADQVEGVGDRLLLVLVVEWRAGQRIAGSEHDDVAAGGALGPDARGQARGAAVAMALVGRAAGGAGLGHRLEARLQVADMQDRQAIVGACGWGRDQGGGERDGGQAGAKQQRRCRGHGFPRKGHEAARSPGRAEPGRRARSWYWSVGDVIAG